MDDISKLEIEKEKLLAKQQELLSELVELKQFRNTINDLGGIDKIKNVFQEFENRKTEELNNTTDVDSLKKQFGEQIEQLKSENIKMRSGMVNNKIQAMVKNAVKDAGGEYDLVSHALLSRIKGEYVDDNTIRVNALTADGEPMIVDGRDASIKDLVSELKNHDSYGKAFNLEKKFTGSGARTSSEVSFSSNPFIKGESYDINKQMELYKSDPVKAKTMMREAGLKTSD